MILFALILCPLLAHPGAGSPGSGLQDPPAGDPAAPPPSSQEKPPPPPPPAPPPPSPAEVLFTTLAKQVAIDGQIRLRFEYRDPTSYLNTHAATLEDQFFLTRIRLGLDFKVTDDIEVYVQPQDERQWGQELSVVSDERNFDLHQGWVEIRHIFGEPLSIKGGRMELSYGDQRLVSPLDWSNTGRAWDGAKVRYDPGPWWVEGFYTVIHDVLPAPQQFAIPTGTVSGFHDQEFMGVYSSYVGVQDHEFDIYAFFREFRDGSATGENGQTGNLVDHTVGGRIKGLDMGFDYTLEGMSQTGHSATDRVVAYAYVATLGYTFDMPGKPRLGVEYDFASGDRHPTDGKRNTFDPLYPYSHYYQGFADTFAFKNGKDAAAFIRVWPTDTLSVNLDFHTFWLSSATDAWYNAAGNILRRDPTGQSGTRVGEETDFHVRLTVNKYLKFWAGWSHFFSGPFVRDTTVAGVGTSRDMDWLFIQMTVDF